MDEREGEKKKAENISFRSIFIPSDRDPLPLATIKEKRQRKRRGERDTGGVKKGNYMSIFVPFGSSDKG